VSESFKKEWDKITKSIDSGHHFDNVPDIKKHPQRTGK